MMTDDSASLLGSRNSLGKNGCAQHSVLVARDNFLEMKISISSVYRKNGPKK